jgi:hypothetical protein
VLSNSFPFRFPRCMVIHFSRDNMGRVDQPIACFVPGDSSPIRTFLDKMITRASQKLWIIRSHEPCVAPDAINLELWII